MKSAAFGPLSTAPVMLSDEPLAPELDRTTNCSVVVVLISVETNNSEVADMATAGDAVGGGFPVPPGVAASPVPASRTVWVELGASSAMMSDALRTPAARGEKTIVMEQEAFGA